MNPEVTSIKHQGLYIEHHHLYPNRPCIVFLHDSLGCVQLWRDFPQKLAEATQCNILMYDRLGYGQSDSMPSTIRPINYMEQEADQLNTILQHFNLNEVILFGHSDGGTIALLTASKYPSRIVATICEAGHIFVEELTLEGIRSALHAYETTNLAERLAKYHGDKVDHLFKAWTTTWMRDDFRSWNIEEFLPSIIAPLLFIQGENDEYGTLQQVSLTVEGVSGSSEACIIPKIGHTPHKEALEKCLLAASNFIKKQG